MDEQPERTDYVEREADLFQAGEYPDRDLTVTEDDIRRLAATEGPIPIQVEHAGGPVRLGEVAGLAAAGRWLKGKLRLYPEANALLERLGVRQLSVAITRGLDRVVEVSVTGAPRVAGARMFSGDTVLFAIGEQPEEKPMGDSPQVTAEQFTELQAQVAQMSAALATERTQREAAEQAATAAQEQAAATAFALRVQEATARVDAFVTGGRVPPAARDEAIALMLSSGTVRFSDADKPVAELFAAFLEKLPVLVGARVKGQAAEDATAGLTDEQKAFFTRHFPGAKLEDVAVNMGRGEVN